MSTIIKSVLGAVAVFLALASANPAGASSGPPQHGEGTYSVTGVDVLDVRPAGNVVFVHQILSIDNAGVLTGPSQADVTCLIRPDGSGGCVGREHFVGSIDGRSGTAEFQVELSVGADGFRGRLTVLDGTGGLQGLHGTGTFQGGSTGVNSLDYVFSNS